MAIWNVKENGEVINTIVADESFATAYAEETGYTLELVEQPAEPTPAPEPSVWDEMAAAIMEGVNDV